MCTVKISTKNELPNTQKQGLVNTKSFWLTIEMF